MKRHARVAGVVGCVVAGLTIVASAGTQVDNRGRTLATASRLEMDPPLPGTLGSMSDVDVFRLHVLRPTKIEVRTAGQTDTEGELLDSTGARLSFDDDSGPGKNFSIAAELDPGVYYVTVKGEPGNYGVKARLTKRPDFDEAAADLMLSEMHSEADLAGVSLSSGYDASGRIPMTDDVDVVWTDLSDNPTDAWSGLFGVVTSDESTWIKAPSSFGSYDDDTCGESANGGNNIDNICLDAVNASVGGGVIADTKLRAAIAERLGKAPDTPVTQADMATLTSIVAPFMGIRNLTGLEWATNLERLDLDENFISDLSALSDLTNLTELVLSNNRISPHCRT